MSEIETTGTAEPAVETPVQSPRQRLLTEIGQKLMLAREARDEPLSVVIRKLRLSEAHLQALEAGNWDSLPDDIYALGFLRQYSRYLALDLDDEIQRIKHDQYVLTRPLTFPDLPVAPSYKWAWIAGAAFVVLFVAFNIVNRDAVWDLLISPKIAMLKTEQTGSDSTESSLAANTDTAGSLTSDDVEEAATETVLEVSPEHASAAPTAPTDSVSASIETQPQTELPEASPAGEATSTTVSAPPSITELAEKPALAAKPEETAELTGNDIAIHHFRFEAVTESVWLQIFLPDETGEAKGEFLKEVLLQPGYHSNIKEAVDSLWITCGNPSALRITVDGQVQAEVGSLGDIGKILRDYQFKVEQQNSD
jgi:cytoskeletal protein RodZ